MAIHDIYPSSKVDPELIRQYGWRFVEDIPTITNEVGRLAPTAERSATHIALREAVDENGLANYATYSGETMELTDFAIAHSPTTERVLGFFALQK